MAKLRKMLAHLGKNESGQGALAIVLILLMLGAIILTPLLVFMSTGLKAGGVYESKVQEFYAADAGVEDGLWQIKYDHLSTLFPSYNPYDYYANYPYSLAPSASGYEINNENVTVNITNVWIPSNIQTPSQSNATTIIQANKLVVTDSVNGTSTWKISISYYKGASGPILNITTLGVWLPPGFTYVAGSSNLWNNAKTQRLYSSENTSTYHSGQAVVWTFSPSYPFAGDATHGPFPGVNNASIPMTSTITFQFSSQQSGATPSAISWISTTGVGNITFSWDADTKVYHITSVAGGTTVDSYIAKYEIRQLGAAVNGDYRAIGNSLMIMNETPSQDPHGIRYKLLTDSSASVTDIPSDASVAAAYLYWSGWLSKSTKKLGASYGTLVNFKINGYQVCFNTSGNATRGAQPITSSKNQTQPINITGDGDYSYSCYRDVTKLVQYELQQESPGAGNYPGNAAYDVGPASGCTLGNTDNEWSYAGWSLIIIYTSASTKGHQLYLYDKFTYAAGNLGQGGNGSDIDVTGNTAGPGGTISGFLVPQQVPGDVDAAKLTAMVGEGDWCYAGDFLAFNAPSQYWSNPWSIPDGNPSKLWDGINLPDTSILALPPYVPNTAAQPDNVWNSYSQSGLSDGIDIKTFHITWASGLLHAGDTSARIDLPTQTDAWNLVYIILSFRSSITTGGTISYLITGGG